MDRPKWAEPCGDRRNAIDGPKALEKFFRGFRPARSALLISEILLRLRSAQQDKQCLTDWLRGFQPKQGRRQAPALSGLASMLAGNRFYRCPQDKFADVVTKISTGLMAVFYAAEDSIRRGEGLTCREMWKQGFVRLIFCVSVRPCASVWLRCGPPPSRRRSR